MLLFLRNFPFSHRKRDIQENSSKHKTKSLWDLRGQNATENSFPEMFHLLGTFCLHLPHGTSCLPALRGGLQPPPTPPPPPPPPSIVVYEGGSVTSQARSLWRLELARTKWAGGYINWFHPMRLRHITTGRYLGTNANNDLVLLHR